MTTRDEAIKAVAGAFATKQNAVAWQTAMLGDGKGTVSTGDNTVYCRLTANSSVVEVLNYRVAPVDGLLVRIAKTPEMPLHWQVIGQADQRADEGSTTVTGGILYNTPPHSKTHGYLGVDQVNLDWRQITTLRVYAYSGFVVGVLAGLLPRPGSDLVVPTQTLDLSSHVPAAGALYTLISIDATGALVATDGTTASGLLALTLGDIPDTPAGHFRLAAVRLYNGQTAITESTQANDIRDLRWPQEWAASTVPGSTSGISTYYLANQLAIVYRELSAAHVVNAEGSASITGDNVHPDFKVQTFETLWNYPGLGSIPAGVWAVTFEAESTEAIKFQFKVFKDAETTPLVESGSSGDVTTRQSVSIAYAAGALPITTSQRLRLEIYAVSDVAIPNTTTATIYYDGANDSRLVLPTASTALTLTNTHILVGNAAGIATDVALSGDATIANTGALSLAVVNSNVGTFGDGSHVAQVTVNAKGMITAAANVTVSAYEVLMSPGATPPDPILTPDGYDWIYYAGA